MMYTLITSKGGIMQFYIEAVATMYQTIYGGVVITHNRSWTHKRLTTQSFDSIINT